MVKTLHTNISYGILGIVRCRRYSLGFAMLHRLISVYIISSAFYAFKVLGYLGGEELHFTLFTRHLLAIALFLHEEFFLDFLFFVRLSRKCTM